MRRLVAVLNGLLMGLVLVVANAGGASASPNLTVTAGKVNTYDLCVSFPCQAPASLHEYAVVDTGGSSVTLAGTLNAGGHSFIGTATMKLQVGGLVTCNAEEGGQLVTCRGSADADGTISGSGVGSISGTCSASNGTLIEEGLLADVHLATLPFVCSISFSGSAPQPVTFTVALAWIGLNNTLSPAAGVGIG